MQEEEKLIKLYNECLNELSNVGLDFNDNSKFGKIDIVVSPRNCKRYGCCKQENPDKKTKVVKKYKRRKIVTYEKYDVHHIEISKWVMQLNDILIKNTIMHELIHCIPKCNNHGVEFKKYASYINKKLGYNISRLGNKVEDLNKSNVQYNKNDDFNYKITCVKCGQSFLRKRLNKNFLVKYRCGICRGKFSVEKI